MKLRIAAACAVAALSLVGCSQNASTGSGSSSAAGTSSATAAATSSASSAASGAKTTEWAGAFCTGIGPVMVSTLQLLKDTFTLEGAAKRDAHLKYIDTVSPLLNDTAAKLKTIGPPTPETATEHQAVIDAMTGMAEGAAKARPAIVALDPADPAMNDKLADTLTQYGDMDKLGTQLDTVDKLPGLKEAFEQTPACVEAKASIAGE